MPLRTFRGARHYAAGSESLERGDPVHALDELSRAAELVPQASEIQNHLGLAYWANGQPEQARNAFDRAIELDCDNTAARQNRRALEEGTAHGG
jgi:Flp pilus assembly protein TadD